MNTQMRILGALILVGLTACGGDKGSTKLPDPPPSAGATTPPPATGTGKVIEVEMTTDDNGSYFKPNKLEAHPGDLIRFKLVTGVHNVHFVADSTPGITNLPAPSDMLQLPDQTFDFIVPSAPGKTLFFQCDPHALLGMVGRLKIEG